MTRYWTKYLVNIIAFLAIEFTTVQFSLAQTSGIFVLGKPNFRVYLDGQFKGLTSADADGLFIKGIEEGEHEIQLKKSGFQLIKSKVFCQNGILLEFEFNGLIQKKRELMLNGYYLSLKPIFDISDLFEKTEYYILALKFTEEESNSSKSKYSHELQIGFAYYQVDRITRNLSMMELVDKMDRSVFLASIEDLKDKNHYVNSSYKISGEEVYIDISVSGYFYFSIKLNTREPLQMIDQNFLVNGWLVGSISSRVNSKIVKDEIDLDNVRFKYYPLN